MGKLKLYTDARLDLLRKRGDDLADRLVVFLIQNPDWIERINHWEQIPAVQEVSDFPELVKEYFLFFHAKPDFIDRTRTAAAQDFFQKNSNLYLSLLGFYSLPYCYAFADGAQVLVRSKRITEEIGVRLSETALFLMDAFYPGIFLTNDQKLITLAKVRLTHAFSRYFVARYAKDWNPDWGIPINQEDLIGTNLAFSLMVMRGMEKLDRFPGKDSLEDLLHYWKLIGFYLGLEIDYWPETAKEAFELEKLIRKRHLKPSEAGRILMDSLLRYYKTSIPDTAITSVMDQFIGYFLGIEASAALGILAVGKLPKQVYGLVLDFSFWKQGRTHVGYGGIRRDLMQRFKSEFGRDLVLNLPIPKRS
ncbi:oxygenase MpaB family protein [Mariniradius sediminis]|uniref:DUF2236 domain-containing protein n=1 Tax=Mariniradius sediminis TaxID=2909237 RepID=A0ABS9BVE5_9BACT|nr:DUF2236 domain-containing protein [Mariniradius sediminis]